MKDYIVKTPWEDSREEAEAFFLDLAKGSLESLAVNQELKDLFPRDSEEEILLSSMIHDQAEIAETFIREAKRAREEVKRRRAQEL